MKLKNRYQSSDCLFNNSICLEIRREPDCNWKINQISRRYSRIHYFSFAFFLRSNKFTKIRKLQKNRNQEWDLYRDFDIRTHTIYCGPNQESVTPVFGFSVISCMRKFFFCGIQGWAFSVIIQTAYSIVILLAVFHAFVC